MPVNNRKSKRPFAFANADQWLRDFERGTLTRARKIDPWQRASLHSLLELLLSYGDVNEVEQLIAILTK